MALLYSLRIIDRYSPAYPSTEWGKVQVLNDLKMANEMTAQIDIVVIDNTHTSQDAGDWIEDTKQIPGPHIRNLLNVGNNSVFIFFCMTMGYFRTSKVESKLCNKITNYLRRNRQAYESRLKGTSFE